MFQKIFILLSFLILTGCDTSVEIFNIVEGELNFVDGKGVLTADYFNYVANGEENFVLQKEDFVADITYTEGDGLLIFHENEEIGLDNGQLGFFYSVPKISMTFNELIHNAQESKIVSLNFRSENPQLEQVTTIKNLNAHCKGQSDNIIASCLKLGKLSIPIISISNNKEDLLGDGPKLFSDFKNIRAVIRNGNIRVSLHSITNVNVIGKGRYDSRNNTLNVRIISAKAGIISVKPLILRQIRIASSNLMGRLKIEGDTISLQL